VSPCPADEYHKVIKINSYLRSLEDFDMKVKTHRQEQKKYDKDPLARFWKRNVNQVMDSQAGERYGCAVQEFMHQVSVLDFLNMNSTALAAHR